MHSDLWRSGRYQITKYLHVASSKTKVTHNWWYINRYTLSHKSNSHVEVRGFLSNIDFMQPNILPPSRRIGASPQYSSHLVDTNEEFWSGDEPPDPLSTRRGCQTSLVGPNFVEIIHLCQSLLQIKRSLLLCDCVVGPDYWRQLIEENGIVGSRVNHKSEYSTLMTISRVEHKVHFRLGFVAPNRMVSGSMNVPTTDMYSFVVKLYGREVREIILVFSVYSEGWAVPPVVKVPSRIAVKVREIKFVLRREDLVKVQRNWWLLCTCLAQCVILRHVSLYFKLG